ncbi:hypothetical protein V6N12_046912 [Hibiscus sabdariffa]|uniref:Uncharacterized protein n=1 Tax=Hibiscus sabdariffa TaxID=183260 RepID=A0ABR2BC14_9ROSI
MTGRLPILKPVQSWMSKQKNMTGKLPIDATPERLKLLQGNPMYLAGTRLNHSAKASPTSTAFLAVVIVRTGWDEETYLFLAFKSWHDGGSMLVHKLVEELGFSDQSTQISPGYSNFKKSSEKAKLNSDSIWITSMESSTSHSSAKGGYWQDAEEDTINATLVGKELPDCCDVENCKGINLGEEELMGRGLKTSQQPNDNVDFNGGMKEESDKSKENGGLDLGVAEVKANSSGSGINPITDGGDCSFFQCNNLESKASDDTNESGLGQSIGENAGLKDDTVSNTELPDSGMGVDQCRVSLSAPMARKKCWAQR